MTDEQTVAAEKLTRGMIQHLALRMAAALETIDDERGSLIALEAACQIAGRTASKVKIAMWLRATADQLELAATGDLVRPQVQ